MVAGNTLLVLHTAVSFAQTDFLPDHHIWRCLYGSTGLVEVRGLQDYDFNIVRNYF